MEIPTNSSKNSTGRSTKFVKKVFMGRNFSMRRTLWLLPIWAIFCTFVGGGFGQSGILDPARYAANWATAGAGALPLSRSTICNTLSPGVSLATLNADIAACSTNGVVLLNAGTYTFSNQIIFNAKNNVTLRGSGPNSTIIKFTSIGTCNGLGCAVYFTNGSANDSTSPGNVATWTAGYSQGTTSITLTTFTTGSITNLHAGSLLILDQTSDISDPGNIYVCQTAGSNGNCSWQGSVGNGRASRGQNQQTTVTSISGSGPWTIGISPAIQAANWTSGKSPNVWFSSALPVTGDGIENLTLDFRGASGAGGGAHGFGVLLVNGKNDWMYNVRSLNNLDGITEHVGMYQSSNITVRDSYFHGSTPSSEGYGVDCGFSSSDPLVENNILTHIASPLVQQGCSGGVYAYNHAIDDFFCTLVTLTPTSACQTGAGQSDNQQLDSHHSVGDNLTLFEGNQDVGYTADNIHGTSFMQTFYRNRYSGFDLGGGGLKATNTWPINAFAGSRYYNIVNNVLGTSGFHTTYKTVPTSSTDCGPNSGNKSIFTLGFSDGAQTFLCAGGSFSIPNDSSTNTAANVIWGNYDTVNAAILECTATSTPIAACPGNERANAASTYPGLTSPSTSFPASFYLASQPAFWTLQSPLVTPPWPAIGGDITGGDIPNVGGHAYSIPAARALASLTPDTGSGINILTGTITTASESGTTATYTFSSKPAYFEVGFYVSVQGVSCSGCGATSGYNFSGELPISAVATNTFSVVLPTSGLGAGTSGTAYAAPVMLFDASTLYYGSAPPPSSPTAPSGPMFAMKGNQ